MKVAGVDGTKGVWIAIVLDAGRFVADQVLLRVEADFSELGDTALTPLIREPQAPNPLARLRSESVALRAVRHTRSAANALLGGRDNFPAGSGQGGSGVPGQEAWVA